MLSQSYQTPLSSPSVPNTAQGVYQLLQAKQQEYDTVEKYLRGSHNLRFATDKFTNAFGGLFREFANNYMKRVINTLSDYLQLDKVETADKGQQKVLEDCWQRSRLSVQSGRIHSDAFGYGNGYCIAAPDSQNKLRVYRQNPRQVSVVYDPEQPERIILAVKLWKNIENYWRLNVYTPELTRRYVSSVPSKDGTHPNNFNAFVPFRGDGVPELRNDLGVVPVFHFANEPDNAGQGTSELMDLIPLQDGLNKSIMDMLVAMEFQAFRQRWATGIEVQKDEDTGRPIPPFHGADRLWVAQQKLDIDGKPIPAAFGEFGTVDLTQFLSVSDAFRLEICRIARIPPHHLTMTGALPSGESQKVAEAPLMAKEKDRELSWGNVWEDVSRYILAYEKKAYDPAVIVDAVWTDVSPRSARDQALGDLAEAQAAEAKQGIGIDPRTTWLELGYTEEECDKFEKIAEAKAAKALKMQQVATPAPVVPAANSPAKDSIGNPVYAST